MKHGLLIVRKGSPLRISEVVWILPAMHVRKVSKFLYKYVQK